MKKGNEKPLDSGSLVYEDGTKFSYRIVRSPRRTLSVQVKKDGEVVARIPECLPYSDGHKFVESNREWIYSHGKKILDYIEKKELFHWTEGAGVLLYGQEKVLHLEMDYESTRFRVCDTGERILVSGPVSRGDKGELEVRTVLETWYRATAKIYLSEKTAWWAGRMGVSYGTISIRNQATRWGSCSGKGNLNFNWKLVLLPEELADYVVVHELAHRTQMNHSKEFWKIVEEELPDYQQRRRKLRYYENQINQKY